jgi:hypothetical protein
MTKLNQIIAVEPSVKSKANREFTDLHRELSKPALLAGISRTYQPKDEENGDKLPSESTLVQVKAEDVIKRATTALTRLFDVTLTKETANATAKADVKVGSRVILPQVPVTYLLFLEKKLVEIHEFVSKLPKLDPSQEWDYDAASGQYRTPVTESVRTKKVLKNHVKAEATDKHPAQVEIFHEDVIVGTWSKREFSGALPATRVNELISRVESLQTAVKFAREEANNAEITDEEAGKAVFDYLFAA